MLTYHDETYATVQTMNKDACNSGFADKLVYDEPMSAHTSWRVGGVADCFYRPVSKAELSLFLQALPAGEALCWIGLGSNLLVRDAGVRGTVICLMDMEHTINKRDDCSVYVSAATPCAKLARKAASWGLSGAEFMAGIPGTVGGALAMNAGAWGSETWQIVTQAEMIDRQGQIYLKMAEEFSPGYRQVDLGPGHWFVGAYMQLAEENKTVVQERISHLLKERAESQPVGQFSCGSVFRNPDNDHAARLIEACDLKGYEIGGASVSSKHANFIINGGQATAADIENLIAYIQAVVWDKFNIRLTPEVKIIGEAIKH